MRKGICWTIVLLLLCQAAVALAAVQTVQTITIEINSEHPLPARVSDRIAASALTVGTQLLAGRPVTEVMRNAADFEQVYIEILDRVLLGYSVQKVVIIPGTATHVKVLVQSWGDVVRDVTVEVDPVGVSAEAAELLRSRLATIEPDLIRVIDGLPVDSLGWSGSVIHNTIQDLVQEKLPEFRSVAQILPGKQTRIRVILIPRGTLVEEVRLALRSRTMPNILLWEIRPEIEDVVQSMHGLPVAFVAREKAWFRQQIQEKAGAHSHTRAYVLNHNASIMPGTITNVILESESRKYRITAEGRLSFGQLENNAAGSLHAGKYISEYDEVFGEITLTTGNMTWDFITGWGRKFGPRTSAGIKYDLKVHQPIYWLEQDMGPHWTLKLDRGPDEDRRDHNEWTLRYKLHDLLSVEYVTNRQDNFLRLIGHL
ncbi:hypothetical protein [Acetonema longum]|uniref:Uncharacterized protein n=1 Tax=Acetonema longum DSM 6540 TaxID=1009370 RepID=F7NM22_9FIRM|nr:hypothetical protein [Acetonema longum]EGO62948.1 hypothetical protein ALO_15742 [Acetonema longum DSM 6540]